MPSPAKILNTLDPNAFEIAMLPRPCRATSIDAKTFGNEVPAAEIVRPITSSLIPKISPIFSRHVVMMYDHIPSHTTLIAAVYAQQPLFSSRRTSHREKCNE